MSVLQLLIPVSLVMAVVGLGVFFWSLKSGQYEDLAGDAERILHDPEDAPLPDQRRPAGKERGG